jgi:hypothetical protein
VHYTNPHCHRFIVRCVCVCVCVCVCLCVSVCVRACARRVSNAQLACRIRAASQFYVAPPYCFDFNFIIIIIIIIIIILTADGFVPVSVVLQ